MLAYHKGKYQKAKEFIKNIIKNRTWKKINTRCDLIQNK